MNWLEIAKAVGPLLGSIIGVLGAAYFGIRRAKQAIDEAREQDEERRTLDQRAVLLALRGELSANIYLVIDALHRPAKTQMPINLRSHIYEANAGRISGQTSRAYAWLSVLYSRINALERQEVTDETTPRLEKYLGHAVFMQAAMLRLANGFAINKLSEITDLELRADLRGYTQKEQELLIRASDLWALSVSADDRT